MFLKHYTAIPQFVTDPLHPGRSVKIARLIESGVTCHVDNGHVYEADANGWVDFPLPLAQQLRTFRNRGSGWFGQAEVADQVRLGAMDQMDQPVPVKQETPEPRRGRPRRDESGERAETD